MVPGPQIRLLFGMSTCPRSNDAPGQPSGLALFLVHLLPEGLGEPPARPHEFPDNSARGD